MYEVCVETDFSSAHHLRGYCGKCEKMHGHNWKVYVSVSSPKTDSIGLVIDFKKLRDTVNKFVQKFDHVVLNELPEFKAENPTTENLSRVIFEGLGKVLNGQFLKVKEVAVSETDGNWASFRK